ncbi:MAG: RsmB/NOP family class I SAM-dependent RNA methyltransferase [Bacteroidota bacterium]
MPSSAANTISFLDRYREIIDDWPAFFDAVHAPLPQTIWANTLKTTPAALASRLPLKPIAWYPGAFRFNTPVKAATLMPYLAGHYQIQEEAALLPAFLMQPKPEDTILDLCAAPGNKTVQMAMMMQSRGLVVANDRSRPRLDILRRSINRLGLTNIGVTVYDATSYIGAPASYDHILADVPCTGEGTVRRAKNKMRGISNSRRQSLQNIQRAILNRAIKLCKPGGRIVYATCTFAPEENEAVVHAALEHFEGKIAIVPCAADGLQTTPGLTSWQGQQYHPDLTLTHRIWPHHNDTGGFFVAVLKKTGPTTQLTTSQEEATQPTHPLAAIASIFETRFGLPTHAFDGLNLHPFGKFMAIRSFERVPAGAPELILAGLPFCKPPDKPQKMKTGASMRWGAMATKNVITLTEAQAFRFGESQEIGLQERQLPDEATQGYVIARYKDMYLGLGFLRTNGGEAKLESLLPKHWVHALNKL